MAWFSFKKRPKSFLGVDFGTSTVRVVELARKGQLVQLKNYGEVANADIQKPHPGLMTTDSFLLSSREMAGAAQAVIREAGIATKEVNFPLPDFSSFFTSFELPPMDPKEVEQAILYEARSYIPLPLSDVTLDWQVEGGVIKKGVPLKVMVAAVPNDVIEQYRQVAILAKLQMRSLEAEVFALQRVLARQESGILAVLDIGARSTTCNIFDKGELKTSHSFNISGNDLTGVLSKALKIDEQEADNIKKEQGLMGFQGKDKDVREIMLPIVDSILEETRKIFRTFNHSQVKGVEKIILAGATAQMPGLREYFLEELGEQKVDVQVANPFKKISCPPILEDVLNEMGPAYAVAVGSALKGLE